MIENKNIKVLIITGGNAGYISPFVQEQADSLNHYGIVTKIIQITGKGFWGYLSNYPKLIKEVRTFGPNIIHAHYGLCGMLAVLQRKVPVITTFHGSDINESKLNFVISKIVNRLSVFSIFVGSKLVNKLEPNGDFLVLSCGINIETTFKMDMIDAKNKLGFDITKRYVLFCSAFSNKVKNSSLAFSAIKLLENVELVELTGHYSRNKTNLLMNACDALLVTSFNESGPLTVKEAMVCGCPIVSTDVGDVIEVIGETKGCFITTFDSNDCAEKIKLALEFRNKFGKVKGRERIVELGLDSVTTAKKIIEIYEKISKVS
ncbi:MAG: glycosyltransferase family 4 protein [Bacteroidota bacterium]